MKKWTAFIVLSSLISCTSAPKRSTADANWYSRMHKLSETHRHLLPIVASQKKFSDPKYQFEISQDIRLMTEVAEDMTKDPKAPDSDPLIRYTADRFLAELRQANLAFNASDLQWARFSLSRTSQYCISCHTRADRGAKDFPMAWAPQLSTMDTIDLVEYYLANRQYAMAMGEARKLASSQAEPNRAPSDWIQTLGHVMGMIIRVEEDPVQAEKLTELALENKAAPFYVRNELKEWLTDIRTWRREKTARTDAKRLAQAKKLVEKGQSPYFRRTQGALVNNLRASGILHTLLENSKSPQYLEALSLSGLVSDSMNEPFLAQFYYESCIRHLPHSLPAERCFSQLIQSVHEAHPYLEGSNYQDALQMQIEQLRRLAEVKDIEDRQSPRLQQDKMNGN
ncbi:MAG: hypothetical protein AB7F86_05800 [Bdellovibrionales bacterium]